MSWLSWRSVIGDVLGQGQKKGVSPQEAQRQAQRTQTQYEKDQADALQAQVAAQASGYQGQVSTQAAALQQQANTEAARIQAASQMAADQYRQAGMPLPTEQGSINQYRLATTPGGPGQLYADLSPEATQYQSLVNQGLQNPSQYYDQSVNDLMAQLSRYSGAQAAGRGVFSSGLHAQDYAQRAAQTLVPYRLQAITNALNRGENLSQVEQNLQQQAISNYQPIRGRQMQGEFAGAGTQLQGQQQGAALRYGAGQTGEQQQVGAATLGEQQNVGASQFAEQQRVQAGSDMNQLLIEQAKQRISQDQQTAQGIAQTVGTVGGAIAGSAGGPAGAAAGAQAGGQIGSQIVGGNNNPNQQFSSSYYPNPSYSQQPPSTPINPVSASQYGSYTGLTNPSDPYGYTAMNRETNPYNLGGSQGYQGYGNMFSQGIDPNTGQPYGARSQAASQMAGGY